MHWRTRWQQRPDIRWVPLLWAIFYLLIWESAWADERCEPWTAKVVSTQGRVEIKVAGQTAWRIALAETTLCPGDSLRVDVPGRAALLLPNETVVRLDQGTTVSFAHHRPEASSWLDLLRGALHFISRTPRPLKVGTPFVNAAVDGTEFTVRVDEDRARVWVIEGRVSTRNSQGQLLLTNGQAAVVQAAGPPRRYTEISPQDAVRWALYYPPILDIRPSAYPVGPLRDAIRYYAAGELANAVQTLETMADERRDATWHGVSAALALTVGQLEPALEHLDKALAQRPDYGVAMAIRALVALVQNQREQARDWISRARTAAPTSAAPWVADAYLQQAEFNLPKALEVLEQAARLEPDNPLVEARRAELLAALGEHEQAWKAAQQAVTLNPDLSRTQTVLGFTHLSRSQTQAARLAFERAIILDQADPLPRLGRGLVLVRAGQLAAGRRELEIAAALDPGNGLVRSYLGKAYSQERRDAPAASQLALAKDLDPHDPTPWLYAALGELLGNRPIAALEELEASISRNDNRAVYRSRLLLDQDLAVRGVGLARIYEVLGFEQLALPEASRSLTLDPSNHSAHRLLSDTYAKLPRHEVARVSELLQSQLLAPANPTPVAPRLGFTDLNLLAGLGPADIGFNEFTPLFLKTGPRLSLAGLFGNNSTLADEVVVSGFHGRWAYSVGQFHYETDGFRANNSLSHDIYNAFLQFDLTPSLSVQAEVRRRDTEHGDLGLNFDPADFSLLDRRNLRDEVARVGLSFSTDSHSQWLLSLLYGKRLETQRQFPVPDFGVDAFGELKGVLAEARYLYQGRRVNFTAGLGTTHLDERSRAQVADCPLPECLFSNTDQNNRQDSAYLYTHLTFPKNLIWTLGLGYYTFENNLLNLGEWSPKLGLEWQIKPGLRLRLAAFETLKRTLVAQQTIEPTQIAGFNQFFDDFNGTQTRRYGLGLDAVPTPGLYTGLEASRRELVIPQEIAGITSPGIFLAQRREDLLTAYLYWTPRPRWALGAKYRVETIERLNDPGTDDPLRVDTRSLPLNARYFHPSGWFAGLGATYVNQRIKPPPGGDLSITNDRFWLVDAVLGYRLPRRRGIVSLEARNLLDKDFLYQDLDFHTSEARGPDMTPERTVVGRLILSF